MTEPIVASRFHPSRILAPGIPLAPLAILFGLNAVDELDRSVFAVLTPEIKDHFNTDIGGITAVIAAASFVALAGQVLVGFYGDRMSRVKFSVIGASVWALFTLMTGLAPAIVLLAIARAGSGLGKAVNDPMHSSLISDYYEPSVRVRAFYWYRIANNVGVIVGPLAGGLLAYQFGWRTPFFVFTVPTVIFVVLAARRLREPVRGRWEREAAGGDEDAIGLEEEPPSFAEAWKTAHSVKALKRIFISLPWFAAAIFGIVSLFSIYYDEIFDLNEAERGFLAALVEPAQIVGSLYGIRLVTRAFLGGDPGRILKLVAIGGGGVAGGLLLMAVAPNLAVAIVGHALVSGSFGPLTAGIYSTMSLVSPPRIRTMTFGIGALWFMPGLVLLAAIGGIADSIGIRGGIALMAPILAIGAVLMASGGAFVKDDLIRVQTSALAQAEIRQSRLEGDAKLLVCRGIDVAYGQTQVLFNVDFHVDDGEIVALLGTNGAGKSTLLSAISGLVEPAAGAIIFDGKDITMKPANETVAAGIVMVPGGKGVFPTLTVQENLELAGWLFAKDKEHVEEATAKVLEYFPILKERWNEKAGNMSGGEQQMLTLGQAFIAKPKLLMIDELSLGLAPVIVEQLLEIVKAIHDQGTTIILVEQSVNVAITVAKRAVFMEKGEVRFDGPTAGLLDRPEILRAVFLQGAAAGKDEAKGATAAKKSGAADTEKAAVGARRFTRGEPQTILETRGLSVAFGGIRAVSNVDIQLREGEILGLIGPNGAGKTTIMDLVSGFLVPTTGRVYFEGDEITNLSPDLRAMRGLGRSFQDARLFPALTVIENLSIALERHIATRDPVAAALMSPATRVSERLVTEKVDELIEVMNLSAFSNKFVGELSTGTRRVVDIACSLAHGPSVLLLDEPSSGIAQRETEALGPVLMNIREQTGAALLVIEHDMPLIQAISDRLIALELGEVIAEGSPTEVVNHPRVVESYLGESAAVINRSGDTIDITAGAGAKPAPKAARRRKQLVAPAGRGGE